ncbi:glycosyltransferase [Methanobrevibacter sp.]|uniref:glycosyltransferase n=1 Tax=Methanobrevibacter sp. TaxID=66852 RepID=UPI00388EFE9B
MSSEYEYKLSVVVLVYNTEEFLEECLDSLVNQTLDDMEIICVNDESKDNSLNILKRYAKKYDNIKIIDQKNTGGATAGNNGLKMAKGEYVTIMDSDDVVVEDAYEKLYNKAKETDSDIVSGKPFKYVAPYQTQLGTRQDMWDKERTVDIHKDIEIFYDVFYWDKIYRREFVEKNDIYMIPGKLYADAPMVFKAFLNAEKITYIEDFVYYWRHRSVNESITKSLTNLKNTEDRLDNYYVLKEYFKDEPELYNQVIKLYLERFIYPIKGILDNPIFKEAYLEDLKKILLDIDDVIDNKFVNMKYVLYTYLIINDEISILEDVLKNYEGVKDFFVYNGKSYWNLKYFRNPVIGIPDEVFEIRNLHQNFINIQDIGLKNDAFYIKMSIPPTLKIDEARIRFNGLTRKYGSKDDNSYIFDLNMHEGNRYDIELPLENLVNINFYDIYLEVVYDGKREIFRLGLNNFVDEMDENLFFEEDKARIVLTSNENLSIVNTNVDSLLNLDMDENRFKIIPNIEEINYKLGFGYGKDSYDVYFKRLSIENTDKFTNELEMKWKYSLEKNTTYRMFVRINKEKYLLKSKSFVNYEDQEVDYEGGKIRLFKDENDYLYIRWECE